MNDREAFLKWKIEQAKADSESAKESLRDMMSSKGKKSYEVDFDHGDMDSKLLGLPETNEFDGTYYAIKEGDINGSSMDEMELKDRATEQTIKDIEDHEIYGIKDLFRELRISPESYAFMPDEAKAEIRKLMGEMRQKRLKTHFREK